MVLALMFLHGSQLLREENCFYLTVKCDLCYMVTQPVQSVQVCL